MRDRCESVYEPESRRRREGEVEGGKGKGKGKEERGKVKKEESAHSGVDFTGDDPREGTPGRSEESNYRRVRAGG